MAKRTIGERFWPKVRRMPSGCWEWQGSIRGGYGLFCIDTIIYSAHRVSWQLKHGPIAHGLVLDHKCRNRACVNPDHLEPVDVKENTLRGTAPTADHARKTHCVRGHPFVPDNMMLGMRGRRCWTCIEEDRENRKGR